MTRSASRIFIEGNAPPRSAASTAARRCARGIRSRRARRSLAEAFSRSTASKLPRRPQDDRPEHASRSSRPKTRSLRSASSSAPAGTARAPSPAPPAPGLADDGVHRPGLLRRDPGVDLRRPARRPLDRHAHAHPAGRPAVAAPTPRTATPSTSCCCPEDPRECFDFSAAALRPRGPAADAVFVMLDLDIGMNEWLCEPLKWDDAQTVSTAARS